MITYPLHCIRCQSDDVELVRRIEPVRSLHELGSGASDRPVTSLYVGDPAGLFRCHARDCGKEFPRELPY